MKQSIFYALLLISLNVCSQAKKTNNKFSAIVHDYAEKKGFSGSVLVADNGKVVYQECIGMASRQYNLPITDKSLFKICSITKTFTATIILQLLEAGKIDLSKTIGFYYPEYIGAARDKATILHLLTYSSGIENIDQSSEAMYAMELPLDSIINRYCAGKLIAEPGTKLDYKNADYIILGKIIEKITGKPYQSVLQENILRPLQMTASGFLNCSLIIPGLASSYIKDSSGNFYNEAPYRIENFFSSGAMYSTTADLLKFDQALFLNKLLKKTTMDLMTTSYPKLWNVALSFWVVNQQFGKLTTKVMDRRGSIGGSNTAWYHIFDGNKTIIVFANSDAADVVEIRQQLAGALMEK
jgi:teichoic acid D-alanine hydrolase